MTVEQKAKAYDKAIERVWELLSRCRDNRDRRNMVYRVNDIESIFPELKKSEDEKIKEDLIEWFDDFPDIIWRGHYKKDVIAWLEKQVNKSINIDIESMVSSYKQRLKSQAGIRMENNPLVNMCLTAFRRGVENTLEELNLNKIEKQGGQEFIDSDTLIQQRVDALADIDAKQSSADNVKPKIKNDIEIPFGAKDSELQEATYFIPKGFHAEIDDDKIIIKKGEKPTAWSEEDERNMQNIDSVLFYDKTLPEDTCIKLRDFLKTLKQRIGG